MKNFRITIEGRSDLLMHNGLLCDPLHPGSKQLKSISSKRTKTDEDHQAMKEVEWYWSFYRDADDKPILPATSFEASVIAGAKKSKLGKVFQSAFFVDNDSHIFGIGIDGKTIEDLRGDARFVDSRPVKVGQARIIRTRAKFPAGWQCKFYVTIDADQLNPEELERAVINAGAMCGIGDYRPQFGRYTVKQIVAA